MTEKSPDAADVVAAGGFDALRSYTTEPMLDPAGPHQLVCRDDPASPTSAEQLQAITRPQRLPLEILTDRSRRLLEEFAESQRCHVEMILPPFIAAIAQASHLNVEVQLGQMREPPGLWPVTVSPSGTGKSPTARPFLVFAIDEERRYQETFQAELARFEEDTKARKKGESHSGLRPLRRRAYITAATPESLLADISVSPCPLYHCDELPALIASAEGYSRGSAGLGRSSLLNAWSRSAIAPSRKSANEPSCESPKLIIFGGIQPSELCRLGIGRGDGLAARFLFVCPPRVASGLGVPLDDKWKARLTNLLDDIRRVGPHVVSVDAEGTRLASGHVERWTQIAFELDDAGDGLLSSIYGKLPLYLCRWLAFMATLRLADGDNLCELTASEVEQAVRYIEVLLTHQRYAIARIRETENKEPERSLDRQILACLAEKVTEPLELTSGDWKDHLELPEASARKVGRAFKRLQGRHGGFQIGRGEDDPRRSWLVKPVTS